MYQASQRIFRFSLLLAAVLACSVAVFADRTDDTVRRFMAEQHAPGVALSVIKNGKVITRKYYGMASVEYGVPVNERSVFEIGSVSKQMTAAAIMLLVQDGKVSLDEKIGTYLKDAPPGWSGITVRHLLNHTSGIKSYSSLDGFELSRRLTVKQFIDRLAEIPLEFEPGTQFAYNNSGYNLLGFIIEAVSGKKYIDFMKERVFKPLGMDSTGDRDPRNIVTQRVTGYEWAGGRLIGRDGSLTDLTGAGSIVSTLKDMEKWALSLRNDTLVTAASKSQMWQRGKFNDGNEFPYGLGFRFYDIRDTKMVGHTGQTAGFGTAVFRYADNDLSVVVMTNLGDLGLGGRIAAAVAKIHIPAMSLSAIKATGPISPEIVQRSEAAIKAVLSNELPAELFTEPAIRQLSTERAKAGNRRIAGFGKLETVIYAGADTSRINTYRFVSKLGKRFVLWRIILDAGGKVSDITAEEDE